MSLCRWVRACGGAGVLLLVDIGQLHRDRRAAGGGFYYTPAAVMDCCEMLRQLIDDTEHFPGLFVAAIAEDAFLSDDPSRSLGQNRLAHARVGRCPPARRRHPPSPAGADRLVEAGSSDRFMSVASRGRLVQRLQWSATEIETIVLASNYAESDALDDAPLGDHPGAADEFSR